MTDSKRIIGIDTARWQGIVPWSDVAAAGVQFGWVKAVHGLSSTTDPQFARSWPASRGKLPYGRGAYEWLTDSDPVKQAEHVVRILEGTGDLGELYPSIDWEEPTTAFRGEGLVLHALRALRRVRELVGGAVLYTGGWYVSKYVARDDLIDRVVSRELLDELCSYPLWHAEYPRIELRDRRACATDPLVIPAPRIGKIWRDRGITCAVHQFDGDGGCTLPNGTDADFNAATPEGLARVVRVWPRAADTLPAPAPVVPPVTAAETPRAREPIATHPDAAATPIRAGEGQHTVATDEVKL